MFPEEQRLDAVCYKQGITVKENFQQCDVTSAFLRRWRIYGGADDGY
jgi:hypothetical protein